jgi:hypothetical protein
VGLLPRIPLGIANRRLYTNRSESALPFSSLESSRFSPAFQSLPLAVLPLYKLALQQLVNKGTHALARVLGLHRELLLQALADLPQAQALFQQYPHTQCVTKRCSSVPCSDAMYTLARIML